MEEKVNLAALGIGNWGVKSGKSKIDLITDICTLTGSKSLDISALTVKDIRSVLRIVVSGETLQVAEMPQARVKAPYLSILVNMFPDIPNLKKLSVSSLKELIQAVDHDRCTT